MKLPTDLKILDEIYERYYGTFCSYVRADPSRATKIMVPVDIEQLARHFDVDNDIIFGRLYYHLEQKYGYHRADGTQVSFFNVTAASDQHPSENVVNFALLTSILTDLKDQRLKWKIGIAIALVSLIGSLITSCASLVVSLRSASNSPALNGTTQCFKAIFNIQ